MPPMPDRPGLRSLLRLLGRRPPRTRGRLIVPGIGQPVSIGRDRWGIPHVEAANDADAWFGLGFCHAQDRGFQLELLARAGRGTLAELLGSSAVPLDRLTRTLGFARIARVQRTMLDPDVEATLAAYVAGINAAGRITPRPHELVLLRRRRTEWLVDDVLAFLGLQSLTLAGNWDIELARLHILMSDGADALRAVDPVYGEWLPVVTPVGQPIGPAVDRLSDGIDLLRDLVGTAGGSNAWAVAGSRTASGAPILANDPHLSPGIPAPWYLAHLRTPDWGVAGASFVGGPVFPSGHNGRAAWGITAACTDSADLFIEQIGADGATVRGAIGPEPLEGRREEIAVRGVGTLVEEVLVTPRGPIITSLLASATLPPLSLSATWLRPQPVRGLLDAHRADDFESFRSAFSAWPGPALNVVYADVGGHIGWQLTGQLPVRRSADGTLPTPGWGPGWEAEPLPFDSMPFALDPPEGFVVSANNAPRADAPDRPFLGVDWLDGYRASRLVAVLGARDDWDVAATGRLQVDQASVPWAEMRDAVLGVDVTSEPARTALGLLSEWDGLVAADSPAAAVYELFVAELAAALARERAPASWPWAIGAGFGEVVARTGLGARTVSHVVGRLRAGDHGAHVASALEAAIETLRSQFGADAPGWAWGRVRPHHLRHPLGRAAPFDRLGVGPVAIGGDANTVAQAGVRPTDPLANPAAIANHRMVVDLADPDASRFVVAGGQSGNPLSPHYADLFELWAAGASVPMAWSPDAVAAATTDVLTLRP